MQNNPIYFCRLFKDLDERDCEIALSLLSAQKQTYPRNSILVTAGRRLNRFGLVLSGTVQAQFTDIDGNSVMMASVSAGDTFGEALCWLEVDEIPITVTAFTDAEVLWLSPNALREASLSPLASELKSRYLSMLAVKNLSMNDRIQVLTKTSIRQKLITYFSQCSNRYGNKTFAVPFDRETLAMYLGVNRSALSRELSAMQKEGIIEFYKNTFKILK